MRGLELVGTGAVHGIALGVAALAFTWQSPGRPDRQVMQAPTVFPLHAPDASHDRPKVGAAVAPLPRAVPSTGIAAPAAPFLSAPASLEVAPAPALAETGGHDDEIAQDVLAWRRAIMARLEAQRAYPGAALHSGWQGSGSVLFHIERSGNLRDVALAQGTGRSALDDAALDIVRRAAPFPPVPASLPDEMAITLPIDFLIDHDSRAP